MTSPRQRGAQAARFGAVLAAAALLSGVSTPAPVHAQAVEWSTRQPLARDAAGDPPARVGRLSQIEGSAWLLHPASGEWIAAQRNRPLTSGDRLSTDAGSRLEWEVGSTAFRLDGATEIEIGRLDDESIEIHLHAGSLALRVRSPEMASGLTLTSEEGLFSLLRSGSYRLDRRNDASRLTVWSGQARYERGEHALSVQQGQSAEFWIDAGRRAQYSLSTPQIDRFTAWAGELDRAADQALAGRHVSPEMTGADDLDRHGHWTQDPEHGAVWTPSEVPAGWAPYASGHWAWVSPWGWTWVDDAPWGFAPFHYGRWIVSDNRWRWAPGRYVARPVYAPALVAWVGGTPQPPHAGGRGGVSWIPLAPREVYLPPYRFSRGHVRDVNAPHFHHPREIERVIQTPHVERPAEYRNRKFHHGTTTIPLDEYGRQRGRIGGQPPRRGDRPFERDADRGQALPITAQPAPVFRSPWRGADGGPRSERDHEHGYERGHERDGHRERGPGRRAEPVHPGFAAQPTHPAPGGIARGDDGARMGGWRSDRRLEPRREGDGWRPPVVISTTPSQPPPTQLTAPAMPVVPAPIGRPSGGEAPPGGDARGGRAERERPFERAERPRLERGERPPMLQNVPPPAPAQRAPAPVFTAPSMQPPAAPLQQQQRPTIQPGEPPAAGAPAPMRRSVDDTPRNRRDPRQQY